MHSRGPDMRSRGPDMHSRGSDMHSRGPDMHSRAQWDLRHWLSAGIRLDVAIPRLPPCLLAVTRVLLYLSQVVVCPCDVGVAHQLDSAVAACTAAFGAVDIMVWNTGVSRTESAAFGDMSVHGVFSFVTWLGEG